MYAWRERLEFNDLIERTRKDSKRYRVNRGLIEGKAVGHSVHQELRRKLVGDFGVELVQPFADKVARTYAVQHLFEEGMIWAPERTWAEMVIDEVSAMSPFGSLAEHDDLTDSTTQGLNWLRQNGFALTKEEGTGEKILYGKELQDLNKPLYDV
jgi:predicted phage terminase large subunit-like protein